MHVTQWRRRRATVALTLLIGPVASYGFTNGLTTGFNGGTASGGSDCTACHEPVTIGTGSVQIVGVPSAYIANRIYHLIVRIEDPDQVGAGYQLSVEDATGAAVGTLSMSDINSQISNGFANHTSTGVASSIADWVALGYAAQYEVTWQAPPADVGAAVFWVAGNAINNAGGNNGDHVYLANYATGFAGDIPTVSEWGLIVMCLLLTIAGTIVVTPKRPAIARGVARHSR